MFPRRATCVCDYTIFVRDICAVRSESKKVCWLQKAFWARTNITSMSKDFSMGDWFPHTFRNPVLRLGPTPHRLSMDRAYFWTVFRWLLLTSGGIFQIAVALQDGHAPQSDAHRLDVAVLCACTIFICGTSRIQANWCPVNRLVFLFIP